jgi:hypothetical protein
MRGLAGGISMSTHTRFFRAVLRIAVLAALALAVEAGKRWTP